MRVDLKSGESLGLRTQKGDSFTCAVRANTYTTLGSANLTLIRNQYI